MIEYIKIETPFNRDTEGTKKLIEGDWRNDTVRFLKDCQWVCTEKIDGCLNSKTKLTLSNGEKISIGEVVEKKLPVEILGYENGNVVPTKVVGWHKNGTTTEWYKVHVDRRGVGTKGNHFQTIMCTGNHKFLIGDQWVAAENLNVGDKVKFIRESQSLTWMQEQIVTGLLLGDGCLSFNGRSVEFSHIAEKEPYVDYLIDMMGNIAGNKQKARISGYGSKMSPARTICCNGIKDYCMRFVNDGKKIIPKDIELSPISLAIFYMDDGSLQHSDVQEDRCIIAMNDYDEESVNNFIEALRDQMHIESIKYFSKGWNLRFKAREFEKLQLLISPYICECMQYKLSEKFRGRCVDIQEVEIFQTINTIHESEIIGIDKVEEIHKRYDITTETHNYFANGILVHNCNISIVWDGHKVTFNGRTERASIPAHLMNRLIEMFGGDTNEEMFEQKFGEMPVILYGEGYGAKIQNGGAYRPDVSFILFDVYLPSQEIWLTRDSVEDIAKAFGIDVVPIILTGTLQEAIDYVKTKPVSTIGTAPMEGLVCRPAVELCDRMGKRVIVKVKVKDFA